MNIFDGRESYAAHLAVLTKRADEALAKAGFESLIVASGVEKMAFLDDMPYPFKVSAQFKAWVPLVQDPNSWIAYTPGSKPILVHYQPDDYWHVPPQPPTGEWVEHFDLRVIADAADAVKHLPASGKRAIIGEPDSALPGFEPNNPPVLLNYLAWHRAYKTPYELALMRRAQRKATAGHVAARKAFLDGGSEALINAAFLAAAGHTDSDVPYNNIVALNENGATLHYQYKSFERPEDSRSLLIDAGAQVAGYSADITRTWTREDELFGELIEAVDREQQALAHKVKSGLDYRQLHLEAHLRLGSVLKALGIVDMEPDAMLQHGVTSVFFPHGLGHPIGLQVHDVAGYSDIDGKLIPRPAGHPYLRMTRTLEPGMVVTIEPGIYFIPTLLKKLRADERNAKSVDWDKVEHLAKFGGVRIEDEVHCTEGAPENLSRDAFAEIA